MKQTTIQSSPEEERDHELYSAAVHRYVVLMNTGVLGFLQLSDMSGSGANTSTSAFPLFETYQTTFLCYWVLILIYAFLSICEIKLPTEWSRKLVGHISHLFGALAAILLVSVVSPILSLIVVPVWLAWLSWVMYICFRELKKLPENSPGDVELQNPSAMEG